MPAPWPRVCVHRLENTWAGTLSTSPESSQKDQLIFLENNPKLRHFSAAKTEVPKQTQEIDEGISLHSKEGTAFVLNAAMCGARWKQGCFLPGQVHGPFPRAWQPHLATAWPGHWEAGPCCQPSAGVEPCWTLFLSPWTVRRISAPHTSGAQDLGLARVGGSRRQIPHSWQPALCAARLAVWPEPLALGTGAKGRCLSTRAGRGPVLQRQDSTLSV